VVAYQEIPTDDREFAAQLPFDAKHVGVAPEEDAASDP
jgi:hypothetical protein